MGRVVELDKVTFTSGELDPALAARRDIKHYYNGAERLRNVLVRPQGGAYRRFGLRYLDEIWPALSQIDPATITASAPNGGTANNGKDDNTNTVVLTTVNMGTVIPYSVLEFDLGSPKTIDAVDARSVSITAGSTNDFFIEYSSDSATWFPFGPAFLVGTEPVTWRRSGTGRVGVTARYWRVARRGLTDLGTAKASIGELTLYQKTANLADVRFIDIDYAEDKKFMLLVTTSSDGTVGNCAVYLNEVWQTDVRFFAAGTNPNSDPKQFGWAQAIDTVIIAHEDIDLFKIVRAGDDALWFSDFVSFDFRPRYRFPDTPQPGSITIDPSAVSGAGINLTASSAFWTPAMVDYQVELPNYKGSGGGTAVIDSYVSATVVTASVFDDFESVVTPVPNAIISEPAMNDTRGWPNVAEFHEGRLMLGNTSQLRNVFFASRPNQPFDFDATRDLADYGFSYELPNGQPEIMNMVSGRHFQVLTSLREYYALPNDTPMTPQEVTLKKTTDSGSKQKGIRCAEVEGATLFVAKDGASIREFVFVDTEQAYQAEDITLLSPHIISSPVDLFARSAIRTQECNLLCAVNDDGTLATLSSLRTQDVTAWSKQMTEGSFLQGRSVAQTVYFAIEREVDGATVRYLEVADFDCLTDCAVKGTVTSETYTATAGQTVFTWTFTDPSAVTLVGVTVDGVKLQYTADYTANLGTNQVTLTTALAGGEVVKLYSLPGTIALSHLEGAEVQVIIDGVRSTPQTVTGGVITPDPQPYVSYEVGLKFPDVTGRGVGDETWILDMPVAAQLPDGGKVGDQKRVLEVTLDLLETEGIYVGANGREPRLVRLPSHANPGPGDAPPSFTGRVTIEGILGYDVYGRVEIVQRYPAKMHVLAMAKKVSV